MKTLILVTIFAIFSVGCSTTSTTKEPKPIHPATPTLETSNGSAGNPVAPAIEVPEPRPVEVPRVKQAQVIGVVRELVNSGCAVKKVASTDGIHYSQLVITCGDVQQAPAVE